MQQVKERIELIHTQLLTHTNMHTTEECRNAYAHMHIHAHSPVHQILLFCTVWKQQDVGTNGFFCVSFGSMTIFSITSSKAKFLIKFMI